jgi:hypothetical protein
MACIQATVAAVLPDATIHFGGSADESIAKGAALYAAAMGASGHEVPNRGFSFHTSTTKQRRLPRSIALELGGGDYLPLLTAHAALPLQRVVPLEVAAPAPGQRHVLRIVEFPPPSGATILRSPPINPHTCACARDLPLEVAAPAPGQRQVIRLVELPPPSGATL